MRVLERRLTRLLAVLLAMTLVATAGDGGSVSGTINVSGSSTVAPVTTRVAEYWEDIEPGVTVNVDGPGTGDGFALFCDGETDISDASRPIKESEAETCAANGIEYIELKVAIDGLAVITHPSNTLECLSFADAYALVGPESQGFRSWSDAQEIATELGSSTEMPDLDLTVTAPGEESGTYDSFVELVIAKIADEREQEHQTRPDYQSSGDDNVILQGIEGARGSFGWVGYAYAVEAGDAVKMMPMSKDPGGECVAPTPETVSDGSYPIARDLYIYVNAATLADSPALEAFIDFYLSDEGIASVPEVGYVALHDDDLEATRSVWSAKETGTRDGG